MIFAEVASRVGLLGKVNLPREPSERARSTGRRERERERKGKEGEKDSVRERDSGVREGKEREKVREERCFSKRVRRKRGERESETERLDY